MRRHTASRRLTRAITPTTHIASMPSPTPLPRVATTTTTTTRRVRRDEPSSGHRAHVRARALDSKPPAASDAYRGALFPGVEVPDNDLARSFARLFPWGNGARVTEKVLGDLLKEEVRAAPLFVPLYDYYREYGG